MLLVGAGNLGSALANYGGFTQRGFPVVAMFDADRAKVKSMLDAAYAVFNKRVATGRASAIPDPKFLDETATG